MATNKEDILPSDDDDDDNSPQDVDPTRVEEFPSTTPSYQMDEETIFAISDRLRDSDIDRFDDIQIGFYTKSLRYQHETFAQMLHRQYADFFRINKLIKNCPISTIDNTLQRHSDGSLKWFIQDVDFSIFSNYPEATICDRAGHFYTSLTETNRNDLITQQAETIKNSCSIIAYVDIKSYAIRNKYNLQKIINKACQIDNKPGTNHLIWMELNSLYGSSLISRCIKYCTHNKWSRHGSHWNKNFAKKECETDNSFLDDNASNEDTNSLLLTALNNLNATITGRQYVPLADNNTYNSSIFDETNFPEEVWRHNSNAENPYYIMKNSDLVPYEFTIDEAENSGFRRITMEESTIKSRHYSQVHDIIAIDGSHYHLKY